MILNIEIEEEGGILIICHFISKYYVDWIQKITNIEEIISANQKIDLRAVRWFDVFPYLLLSSTLDLLLSFKLSQRNHRMSSLTTHSPDNHGGRHSPTSRDDTSLPVTRPSLSTSEPV